MSSGPIGRGKPIPAWMAQQNRDDAERQRPNRHHRSPSTSRRSRSPDYRRRRRSRSSDRFSPSRRRSRHDSRSPGRHHYSRPSRRSRSRSRSRSPRRRSPAAEVPRVNSIVRGTVMRLERFGAFVKMEGIRREGLVHISQISSRRVESIEDALAVDEQVWVKDEASGKISLSLKNVSQADGSDLDPYHRRSVRDAEGSLAPPELYSVHKGKVVKVEPFGAFVQISGFRKQGLVHISHMAEFRVETIDDVCAPGDEVWVKEETGKISLSMKLVNQTSGEDLDPNNNKLFAQIQRRGPVPEGARPISGEESMSKASCSKCGLVGHFASQCFASKGGKKYELISEEAIAPPTKAPLISNLAEAMLIIHAYEKQQRKAKKKSSSKRKHRHHKSRQRRHRSRSSSGDSDSDSRSSSESDDKASRSRRRRSHSASPRRRS